MAAVMKDAACGTAPFALGTGGVGVFPGIRRPRILWIGLKGDTAPLIAFQQRLESRLEGLGFPLETRPFKAHLTIGRARGPVNPKTLATLMEAVGAAESLPLTADRLILFQSELFPTGPVYTALEKADLTGTDGRDGQP